VCRLVADEALRINRLVDGMPPAGRVTGTWRGRWSWSRVLERLGVEEFTVATRARPVRSVARDVLTRAGWIAAPD
jgi:hypothetical protein